MHKKGPSTRLQRINELVERQLAKIIQREISDPQLKMITVTGVEVSRDLAYAKIYFTVFPNVDPDAAEKTMNTHAQYLRGRLASSVDLRVTPELRFLYDRSIAYGEKMADLLNKIQKPEE